MLGGRYILRRGHRHLVREAAVLAVALVVLALGAVNKQIVSRWLATDPPQGRRLLRLTLGADAAVFLTALALVSWASTVSGPS